MKAIIKSIKLIENGEHAYWQITLADEEGNTIGNFGDAKHCNDIDFRNQTFYMMKVLNNWNLLKLDGITKKFPILVDATLSKIGYLANQEGDYISIDDETGVVISGKGRDVSGFEERYVSDLTSGSGCLKIGVKDTVSSQMMLSGALVYFGFLPINYRHFPDDVVKLGAHTFKEFIVKLLNICKITELLEADGPMVSYEVDEDGNISSIGNIEGTEVLAITENGYEYQQRTDKVDSQSIQKR